MTRFSSAAALASLAASAAFAQTETKTLKGKDLAIYNLAGRLKAVAGTGDAVSVEITRVGPDASKLKVLSSGSGLEAHADLVVSIPKGQRIALNLAVGRVDITNVDGDLMLDVGSADVDVSGAKGVLTLDHVSGGYLTLDTGSGSVDATDLDVKEFRAEVGSGGVRVTRLKSPNVTIETGSGSAQIEIIGAVERMSVESGSGGVTIRAPANLGAEIDATTGSGLFESDFDIVSRRLGRRHVEGTIGDGKGRIRLESGSGTIRLQKM